MHLWAYNIKSPQKNHNTILTEDLIVELSVEFGIAQTTNKSLILEFEEYLKEQEQIFIKFCKDSNRQYSDMNLSFKRHIEGARQAKIDFFTELRWKIKNQKYYFFLAISSFNFLLFI